MSFPLGRVVATPGALEALPMGGIRELIGRHASGDWGNLDGHDRRANDQALKHGFRLLSSYDTPAGRVWIITEADRSSTCVLLPSEY